MKRFSFFFFNDTATTEIYTLSLHDALPICPAMVRAGRVRESTDLLQICRVGRDALFQEAWCWLWKQRQLGVEILIQSAHQGYEVGVFLRICRCTGSQLRACELSQTPHVALL